MMSFIRIKLLLMVCFFLSNISAFAGLLFEPYAGFSQSITGTINEEPKLDLAWGDYEIGGRLGWIFETFALGVDYDQKGPKVTASVSGQEQKMDIDMKNAGVFIGAYWSNWVLRAKYYFEAEAIMKKDSSKTKGTAFGLDIGYRFVDWLALNFEYTNTTLDEPKPEIETTDILVSLSFPLEFFRN
jgi:hypothetical protein